MGKDKDGKHTTSANGSAASNMATGKYPPDKMQRRRRIFKSFMGKALANRSFTDKIADEITAISGSVPFLIAHIYWFIVWILINTNAIPGFVAFDPFPFGLLTMIVSLEAIVLSVFVLLSQNRGAKIDSLREELDLQINLIAEEEITKCLEMLAALHKKMGILQEDVELDRMLNRLDTSYIERTLQKQIDNGSQSLMKKISNPNGNANTNGNGKPKEGEQKVLTR
jgi:uncharacterized membrane protein